jgi:presqualene diphosphate phosphatase
VTILKPIFRRPRPLYNRGLQSLTVHAVDQFSFPSGHATRAVHVACYLLYIAATRPQAVPAFMSGVPFLTATSLWAAAVCLSRVALGRHHVVDILVGTVLGALYIVLVDRFWIQETVVASFRDAWFPSAAMS